MRVWLFFNSDFEWKMSYLSIEIILLKKVKLYRIKGLFMIEWKKQNNRKKKMHGKKLKIGSTMNAINSCTEMNFKNGITNYWILYVTKMDWILKKYWGNTKIIKNFWNF